MNMKSVLILFLCTLFISCNHRKTQNEVLSVDNFKIEGSGTSLVCMDTLDTGICMQIVKEHYTADSKEVFAVVSNPQRILLGYDTYWDLEKVENGSWKRLKKKKETIYWGEESIPVRTSCFYCFRFPIEYYHMVKGKYRIIKQMYRNGEEFRLYAEFEIQ